ncbi:hypothetical protein AAE478_008709 [Parahypoxylon ruwenzoriense]
MSSEHLMKYGDASDIHEHPDTLSEVSDETPSYGDLQMGQKGHYKYGLKAIIGLLVLNISFLIILIGFLGGGIIQYESRYFRKYGHWDSPFSQKAGPGLDDAWHTLLSGMNIRAPKEWLEPFGVDSVRLADGSGVLVQLGVYHELHCLKKLKHWNYRSHYYGNLSDVELKEEESHIEHCLEWLRVAALCRGDTTLTTFHWGGRDGSSLQTDYPIPHQCVNSERLLRWSEERAVDITQEGLLEIN